MLKIVAVFYDSKIYKCPTRSYMSRVIQIERLLYLEMVLPAAQTDLLSKHRPMKIIRF